MRITSLLIIVLLMPGCAWLNGNRIELSKFEMLCNKVEKTKAGNKYSDQLGDSYREVKRVWAVLYDEYKGPEFDGKRKLIVFMDGTANSMTSDTNIWQMYLSSLTHACSGKNPVIPYYDQGVGASWFGLGGKTSGLGASLNIRQAYRFLVQTHKKDDEIFIFGFSRGAFTARSLNGMLEYVGLLDKAMISPKKWYHFRYFTPLHFAVRDLYNAYHLRHDGTHEFLSKTLSQSIFDAKEKLGSGKIAPKVNVTAIGVFDTVASLGLSSKSEPDNHRLDLYASEGYHALSLDEQRRPFQLLRFHNLKGLPLEEVWFPGVHSNVGGGYSHPDGKPNLLSKLPYDWMISKFVKHGVFPGNVMKDSCEKRKYPCELDKLEDEFLGEKGGMWRKLGIKRRWPRDNDLIHGSVYCRTGTVPLPSKTYHHQREPSKIYDPSNLKKEQFYMKVDYLCSNKKSSSH